jgi:hypothetical protein
MAASLVILSDFNSRSYCQIDQQLKQSRVTQFPNDEVPFKILYLAARERNRKWTARIQNREEIFAKFLSKTWSAIPYKIWGRIKSLTPLPWTGSFLNISSRSEDTLPMRSSFASYLARPLLLEGLPVHWLFTHIRFPPRAH